MQYKAIIIFFILIVLGIYSITMFPPEEPAKKEALLGPDYSGACEFLREGKTENILVIIQNRTFIMNMTETELAELRQFCNLTE